MKRQIIYLSVVLAVLSGCSSQNVVKVNDTIVHANSDLKAAADSFNKKFESVINNNYSVLEEDRKKMASVIDEKVKEVAALKADMPGGEDFRNAFVDYYKFEKDIYDTDYKDICTITGEGDSEKLSQIAEKMKVKATREESMEKNIHVEQEKFASKNNLKLKY